MTIRNKTTLKALVLAIAVFAMMPAVANAACLSQAESYRFVKSGQVLPLSKALKRAGVSGRVVRVALCKTRNGPPRYRLAVIDQRGNLIKMAIPAR